MNRPPAPWKPPVALLALDALGTVVLGAGLMLHYAPEGPLAGVLAPAAAMPLMVVGGCMLAAGSIWAVKSVFANRRR